MRWIVIVVVALIALTAFGPFKQSKAENFSRSLQPVSAAAMERNARDMCKQFVTPTLKAPATAKYGPSGSWLVEVAGVAYSVTGYVDAQNSFGALIRSTVTCELTHNGGTSWTATRVEVTS